MCCNVLQCVAQCCNVEVCCNMLQCLEIHEMSGVYPPRVVVLCCTVAVCDTLAVYYNVLQCLEIYEIPMVYPHRVSARWGLTYDSHIYI